MWDELWIFLQAKQSYSVKKTEIWFLRNSKKEDIRTFQFLPRGVKLFVSVWITYGLLLMDYYLWITYGLSWLIAPGLKVFSFDNENSPMCLFIINAQFPLSIELTIFLYKKVKSLLKS